VYKVVDSMTMMMENAEMRRQRRNHGFSFLEMMVSVAILLIIAGAAFSVLGQSQRVYGSQQLQVDMHAGLRGVFELMAQEIGQAGSLTPTPQTLTAAVAKSTSSQIVTLSSVANIFVGELLTVDTGANQEVVQVTTLPGSNQVAGIFLQNHSAGAPVLAQGVFPNGVLTTTAGDSLQLFGDINADGTLAYVEYDCNPGTATAPGTLTRSFTVLAPGVTTQNPPQVLLNTLISNPNGTSCFTPSMGASGAVTSGNCSVASNTFTCVTDMQVVLTVQTSEKDPQTGAFMAMTKSFLNISSRDVLAAYNIATSSNPPPNLLQIQPPGLPLR
jgi:prepilin-type N-terminal cleavage/methylation domain-containing protein